MMDRMAGVTIRDDCHVGARSAACARRAYLSFRRYKARVRRWV